MSERGRPGRAGGVEGSQLSGGDALRGYTRSHPEHDGQDLSGRWYYIGDDMGEQVAAGSFKKHHSCECLDRTDMSVGHINLFQQGSAVLYNWSLPVISRFEHLKSADD